MGDGLPLRVPAEDPDRHQAAHQVRVPSQHLSAIGLMQRELVHEGDERQAGQQHQAVDDRLLVAEASQAPHHQPCTVQPVHEFVEEPHVLTSLLLEVPLWSRL